MTLTDDQKAAAIAARRGPLEHELFAAELDLKVHEAADDPQLAVAPRARVEEVRRQLGVLDDESRYI